jgi:hypothetical protein
MQMNSGDGRTWTVAKPIHPNMDLLQVEVGIDDRYEMVLNM